ncbi:MAG: cell division topological specificity factor MinE [Gammaproteobacteria bacterium]
MSILDYFVRGQKTSASVAKERLQIILAREHSDRSGPDYLPALKRDLLQVVSKYVDIDLDQIQVTVETEGDCEIIELNIVLPESPAEARSAASYT